ncbi:hypothetical protein [Caballeronia sp. dw_19]|uniref:hypothetical protein n=1 Tax=Caballeronia sp. dw_19 TaxID=2719791 RepID=UPI0023EECA8A|nr:hypothetical protein [Caballeronia sp. dw_19]
MAKLKAALTDKLGRPIDVNVNVGPARRTAAAVDAATRAQRQQEAEQECKGRASLRRKNFAKAI